MESKAETARVNIPEALEELLKECQDLDVLICNLTDRLLPVLRNDADVEADKVPLEMVYDIPMLNDIYGICLIVRCNNIQLKDIITHLGI